MKRFSAATFIFTFIVFSGYAWCADFKDKNSTLWDIRNKDNSIYLNRFSASKDLTRYDIKTSLFGESQWNFGTSRWDKVTAGLEAKKIVLKYVYLGESIQFIYGDLLDYMTFDPGNLSYETTVKLGFIFPLSKKLSFRIWNEYSYNLEQGAAGLNEVLIEIPYKVNENLDVGIGWRHTDRIHTFDSDYATTSVVLHF